jgi:ABC-2 type transport system permease protein
VVQGAVFSGLFSGLTLARDFENGMARRLLLGASNRQAVVLGYVLTGLGRAPLTTVVLFGIGLAAGMRPSGNVGQLLLLFVITEVLAAMGALWASGLALRMRTIQAAPLMQMPAFLGMYLAPAFVPIALITGWLHTAAALNPFSLYLEAGRGLISGTPAHLPETLALSAAIVILLGIWAMRGTRRATAGAG